MSPPVSREVWMFILQKISTLYRFGIISFETKQIMAELTQKGQVDKFDSLYDFCQTLPSHPILEEIKDVILFQN